jgi:hypothetical protein
MRGRVLFLHSADPVDARLSRDAAPVHARARSTASAPLTNIFLGSQPRNAQAAKCAMIDHRDRAPGAAHTSRCDLRRGCPCRSR